VFLIGLLLLLQGISLQFCRFLWLEDHRFNPCCSHHGLELCRADPHALANKGQQRQHEPVVPPEAAAAAELTDAVHTALQHGWLQERATLK
jgi:hypothetical protein